METKIKNVSLITDNSTYPPTVYKSNEVITIKRRSIPIIEKSFVKRTYFCDNICCKRCCCVNKTFLILLFAFFN